MRSFEEIYLAAAERVGSVTVLEEMVAHSPYPLLDLNDMNIQRWLAVFSRHVFCIGVEWRRVGKAWSSFEDLFHGFEPDAIERLEPERIRQALRERDLPHHPGKIQAVWKNARLLKRLEDDHGSAAGVLADWPDQDYAGLLRFLARNGSWLSGSAAQFALRHGGKPSFILTPDVLQRLMAEGVVDRRPRTVKELYQIQDAFNEWMAQSGRSLTDVSRVLALSAGGDWPDKDPL